ncbi:nucleolar protein 58 [Monomorium pharaonis]|uniref:nucleolar protein 58 n=1 Tax=Monomorium pharaonis TaxID=307658 RepID=UPI00063F68AB|nr:nucleolar protein 58 [Monomorium pharaonis]
MLVLFETPAGYAIFKLLDEKKLAQSENLYKDFESPEDASRLVKLTYFHKFEDTTEALAATTALVEGKLSKSLKKTLKNSCKEAHEQLAVADAKLGCAIKEKLSLSCVSNTAVQELMRCIRNQMDSLVSGVTKKEMAAMALGLAHSLSRYKLKFSPDKIDTMVIQGVCLLDDLDKELNNYIMRAREWYGWHFPELGKIVTDNLQYIKTMQIIGQRDKIGKCDLSDILPEDIDEKVRQAAETSMGSEISEDDVDLMLALCNEIIELHQYRADLNNYLKSRMMTLAPNLSILVGDLIGARLISKAGSLHNLAKHPASTLQILGAEKALFRALKSKKNTPKYGLIYHSQLVGQSSNKNKGKMSRMLAAKASLATRFDALRDTTENLGPNLDINLGMEHRATLERRLKLLEEGNIRRISGTARAKATFEKYHSKNEYMQYSASADSTLPSQSTQKKQVPLIEEIDMKEDTKEEIPKKKKKKHSTNHEIKEEIKGEEVKIEMGAVPKKKKKRNSEPNIEQGECSDAQVKMESEEVSPKKKKKYNTEDTAEASGTQEEVQVKTESDIALKKKKKHNVEPENAEDLSTLSKKKKKHSIESKTEDIGEASGTQEIRKVEDSDFISKKKKKKKKESIETEETASVKIEETFDVDISGEAGTSEEKKKKKKKKKEKESEEMQQSTVSVEEVEEPVSSEKKKKKKKKSKEE